MVNIVDVRPCCRAQFRWVPILLIVTVANDAIRKIDPANYSYPYLHSLAFVLRPYLRVGWGSQTHTASPLWAFGMGPGSSRLNGLLHNTQLFDIMKAAME